MYGPCEQDSEEEIQNLDFSIDAKSYFCKKKFLVKFFFNFFDYAFMYNVDRNTVPEAGSRGRINECTQN